MSVVELDIHVWLLVQDVVGTTGWRVATNLPVVNGQLNVLGRLLALRNRHDLTVEENGGLSRQENSIIGLTLN